MEKVSVVIPGYNSSSHIKTAIDSVLNQAYANPDHSVSLEVTFSPVWCIRIPGKC